MPAVIDASPALAPESTTRTVVYTTLYDLMPRSMTPLNQVMKHTLPHGGRPAARGHARWLRDVDVAMLETEPTQRVFHRGLLGARIVRGAYPEAASGASPDWEEEELWPLENR